MAMFAITELPKEQSRARTRSGEPRTVLSRLAGERSKIYIWQKGKKLGKCFGFISRLRPGD